MVKFTTILKQFREQGEKTGWTYFTISSAQAGKLKPGNKKSFRVKGKLDEYKISGKAILPMGEGDFIMPVNATMRKAIRKGKGASLKVELEVDEKPIIPPADLLECLKDEPEALNFFKSLNKSHQNYFGNWIKSAKTQSTRDKRVAQCITALGKKFNFGQMLRSIKQDKMDMMGE
ncbi:MAG: hypothetical protein C5B52_11935 [Bacteroidetes bacterium]|nr:MAG: hypothetical protein C5B52_11935 [Bacteroidota bacterium]